MPMIATLEKILKVKLPSPEEFHTPEANALFSKLCEKHEVN
jgi:lysyl-tRNA synthetase, class II